MTWGRWRILSSGCSTKGLCYGWLQGVVDVVLVYFFIIGRFNCLCCYVPGALNRRITSLSRCIFNIWLNGKCCISIVIMGIYLFDLNASRRHSNFDESFMISGILLQQMLQGARPVPHRLCTNCPLS